MLLPFAAVRSRNEWRGAAGLPSPFGDETSVRALDAGD
jgi:hypothetical protein